MVKKLNLQFPPDKRSIYLGAVAGVALTVLLVMAAFFARGVAGDLERLRSTYSDNMQWMLSQVEVEYFSFVSALDYRDEDGNANLGIVREKYDVLYSRVDTVHNSPMFQRLTQDQEFQASLTVLTDLVFQVLPIIDGTDNDLRAAISDLFEKTRGIRSDVRKLSVSGLSRFARESDVRRKEMAQTLYRLGNVSAVLLLAFTAISLYLLFVNHKYRLRSALLTQVNERMNTVLSTSLDAVIVATAAGNLLEFNKAAERIFQRKFIDVKGKLVEDIIVPPDLRHVHRTGMQRINNDGDSWILGKDRVRANGIRANGEVFPMEVTLQAVPYGKEKIIIGFLRDISQRVADEMELIAARDRALTGEKAKADFLTMMSHEIRTPLNGILGNLSLLDDSCLTAAQQRYVRNMKISGDVLMGHIDAVLDIAMLEDGKLAIANEPVHLGALLQDLIDGQSGNAISQGIGIEWKWVGPPHDWINSDPQKLHQLLLNLLGNAIKFTETGRVVIEAEMSDDGGRTQILELRIVDTGIGIPEGDIEKLFEDFHTNDATFGRVAGGTGLGLGIARRLVKALAGEIHVKSVVNKGSTFTVRVPVSPVETVVSRPLDKENHGPQQGLNILVVEDNEINLEVVQNMLERDGHKVTTATNGRSGVEKAQKQRYDFIFMDISMPVMDGIQATNLIRAGNGPSAKMPIIALSANAMPNDQERFIKAGMNAYISKPLTLKTLRRDLSALKKLDTDDPETPPPLDSSIHRHLDEMCENLGPDTFATLLARFIAECDALVAVICQSSADKTPFPAFAAQIHKVAGSAAVFGTNLFRQVLLDLEDTAKAEDAIIFSELSNQLKDVWSDTRKDLQCHN